jgi:hypothetical protein
MEKTPCMARICSKPMTILRTGVMIWTGNLLNYLGAVILVTFIDDEKEKKDEGSVPSMSCIDTIMSLATLRDTKVLLFRCRL